MCLLWALPWVVRIGAVVRGGRVLKGCVFFPLDTFFPSDSYTGASILTNANTHDHRVLQQSSPPALILRNRGLWNWTQLMFFACPAYVVSWCFFGLLISGAGERYAVALSHHQLIMPFSWKCADWTFRNVGGAPPNSPPKSPYGRASQF